MAKRLCTIILIILTTTVLAAAQKPGATPAPSPANLPNARVAVVDSRAFGEGIAEMKRQFDKLEGEIKPRYTDLQDLQNRLETLNEDLKNPKDKDNRILQQKADQLQSLKKEFERKQADLQEDYQKRSEVVLGPLREKILKFLDEYAKSHNITMVYDLAPASQAGLLFFNPSANITEDFIQEYNKLNKQ